MQKTAGTYGGYRDLKVYQMAYQLALEIFRITKNFPKEEQYALVDQIRRSSRNITVDLAEAWKKRRYEKALVHTSICGIFDEADKFSQVT